MSKLFAAEFPFMRHRSTSYLIQSLMHAAKRTLNSSNRPRNIAAMVKLSTTDRAPADTFIEAVPLGTGPPTHEELVAYYPAQFTWDQLRAFLVSGDLRLVRRHLELEKRYHKWCDGIKQEHGSIGQSLLHLECSIVRAYDKSQLPAQMPPPMGHLPSLCPLSSSQHPTPHRILHRAHARLRAVHHAQRLAVLRARRRAARPRVDAPPNLTSGARARARARAHRPGRPVRVLRDEGAGADARGSGAGDARAGGVWDYDGQFGEECGAY